MFCVKASAIHGLGLFAARQIKAGETIGRISGRATIEDGPHVLWLTQEQGVEVQCELRYINHSAVPNACYYDDLTVVALRDIKVGEEITHDYGEAWHEDHSL